MFNHSWNHNDYNVGVNEINENRSLSQRILGIENITSYVSVTCGLNTKQDTKRLLGL
jgi:hypothetical protein